MLIAKLCLTTRHISMRFALPLLGLGFAGLMGPWPLMPELRGLPLELAAAVIVYATACLEDSLTRIPQFVLYGADASYAIYLFHPFIAPAVPVVLMRAHLVYPWLSVACSVMLALAGGCLVHQFVEAPITQWFRNHLLAGDKKIIHPVATAQS
jgi:exopolysaccharide production protein ExoZ